MLFFFVSHHFDQFSQHYVLSYMGRSIVIASRPEWCGHVLSAVDRAFEADEKLFQDGFPLFLLMLANKTHAGQAWFVIH